MAKSLLDVAAELEAQAQSLRVAHAIMTGERVAAAKRALPQTLKAASRVRAAAVPNGAGPTVERGSIVRGILAAFAKHGAMTFSDVAAAINHSPSGHLSRLAKRGILTATNTPTGFRYALSNAGRARVKANGDAPKTPRTNGKAKPRADDPPTALRGKRLTAFALKTIAATPSTLADLVAALQAVGHPITSTNGIAGPMGKFTSAGFLRRNGKGIYHLTPKGARRLKTLDAKAATAGAS